MNLHLPWPTHDKDFSILNESENDKKFACKMQIMGG